ncbi:MAG: carboxymuconolactone decarboxylase family protein [Acidimicrobiales bacterium]|jgi:AhpD family alkylhydroperoxidase|nr:carboxymuconolactone decarboxylase family protein [Actinomycetota bacterium]
MAVVQTVTDYAEVLSDLSSPISELREHVPEVWSAYAAEHKAVLSDGALSAKTKELMALAVAVVKRCDGCIASHARGAARRGATPGEVAETIGVTMLMDGGPATVYGPRAWQAYQQFSERYAERSPSGGAAGATPVGGGSDGRL